MSQTSVKKIKFTTLQPVALAFATLWLTANGALAEQTGFANACRADIKALCAGVAPGEGRLEGCIKAHSNELSQACRGALLKDISIRTQCAADIKQNCAGVPPGNGSRLEACMKIHLADLSSACKKAIEAVAPDNR
jgi:hypothetical protein